MKMSWSAHVPERAENAQTALRKEAVDVKQVQEPGTEGRYPWIKRAITDGPGGVPLLEGRKRSRETRKNG